MKTLSVESTLKQIWWESRTTEKGTWDNEIYHVGDYVVILRTVTSGAIFQRFTEGALPSKFAAGVFVAQYLEMGPRKTPIVRWSVDLSETIVGKVMGVLDLRGEKIWGLNEAVQEACNEAERLSGISEDAREIANERVREAMELLSIRKGVLQEALTSGEEI